MARDGTRWTRQDSLVVLASYVERPRESLIPPRAERERVANLLGVPVEPVTDCYWRFAALDPENEADGETPGPREERLWSTYTDDRLSLMMDAEYALEERRHRPKTLFKD